MLRILLLLISVQSFAQCKCDFTISLNAAEYFFDGVKKGVKPGQTICFESGVRTGFQLRNIKGTKANPVIITNKCDGQVTLNAPSNWGNVLSVEGCSNIILHGSNNPNLEYGIKITGGQAGLNFQKLTTDFEAHHIEVGNVGCSGILAKTDPTCDSKTWRGNFTLRNANIHHNKVYGAGCEGFYIGNSHYDTYVTKTCGLVKKQIYEHGIDSIEIYFNDIQNISFDGLQVGGAKNAIVHDNYINNVGIGGELYHQNGLQIGGGTTGANVFNNWIEGAQSYSIIDGGGAGTYYNNVLLNAKEGAIILMKDKATTGARIYHNTIVNNGKAVLTMFTECIDPVKLQNNIIVFPVGALLYKYNYQPKNLLVEGANIITQQIEMVGFKNVEKKNFRLAYGSQGIDFSNESITFDYSDRARDSKPDAGALESVCTCICE